MKIHPKRKKTHLYKIHPIFSEKVAYEFYAAELEHVDYSLITGYDDTCKEAFGAAIVSVQEGKQSKEDALKEFYTVVTTQYPEREALSEGIQGGHGFLTHGIPEGKCSGGEEGRVRTDGDCETHIRYFRQEVWQSGTASIRANGK